MSVLLALLFACPAPHDDSLSFSRVEVAGSEASVTLTVQVLSLAEVVDGLDADGDGRLSGEELERRRGPVGTYCSSRYALRSGAAADEPGSGRALAPADVRVEREGLDGRWVTVRFACRDPLGAIDSLELSVDPFVETSPAHLDRAEVVWSGARYASLWLGPGARRQVVAPPGPGEVLVAGLRSGLHRAAVRPELAALVLLLASGTARRRPLAGVTALFLALHLTGVVLASRGSPGLGWLPPRSVGLAAVLSVPYLAADLELCGAGRPRRVEAALFGLVHGLSFDPGLAATLARVPERGASLAGTIVAASLVAALGLVLALPVAASGRAAGIRWLLAVAGLAWFAARVRGALPA